MEIPVPNVGAAVRPDASERVGAHRFSSPFVRELTARDMDEQRRLVQASLLPRPRASATRAAPRR
jgi:hypothetical protein